MPYTFKQVINASNQSRRLPSELAPKHLRFRIRTAKSVELKEKDTESIEELVSYIETKCGVKLVCIGGGAGCTEVEFAIEVSSGKTASEVIKELLSDPDAIKELGAAKIRVIVDESRDQQHSVNNLKALNNTSSNENTTVGDNTIEDNTIEDNTVKSAIHDRFGNKITGTDNK